MTKKRRSEGFFAFEQLKKYAEDFSEIYKSDKAQKDELQAAYVQLYKHAEDITGNYKALKEAHAELEEAYLDTMHRLVIAAEYRDADTGDHITRMSRYSALIAEKLGLPDKEVQNILYAAPMHDIGKIGISDKILVKPGKLTDEEFSIMKTHSIIGAKILASSHSPILKIAEEIALSHHEKWNGKGYPQGLAGETIPLSARIVAVADVFDALTSKRPYKDPMPVEQTIDIIKSERGEHFDPRIVDVFLENIDEVLKIKNEINSAENKAHITNCL
jgi:putative two-component system response regulator